MFPKRNREELNVQKMNEEEKLNSIYSNLLKTREAIAQHTLSNNSEPLYLHDLLKQYTEEWKKTKNRVHQLQKAISAFDKTKQSNSILRFSVLGILFIVALVVLSQVVVHVGKEKMILSGAFSTEITNQSEIENASLITTISSPEQLEFNNTVSLNETPPEVPAPDQLLSTNQQDHEQENEFVSISSIGINDFSIQTSDPVVLYLNATYDMADIYGRDDSFNYFLQFKWNISSIPAGATINNATMCAFLFTTVGTLDSDTNITRVTDQTWDESSFTSTINGQTLTNRTNNQLWSSVTTNLYGCVNVTNQIITDYTLANNFSTVRINDPDHIVGTISSIIDDNSEFRWGAHNTEYRHRPREYTTQSQRPYLNVTYTLDVAADSVAPIVYSMSPANNTLNTTDTTPDFKFNATDETAATLNCSLYLNNSAGTVTNYGRNSSVVNNTPTIITANDTLTNDDYYWWVNCSDGTNTNVSEQRNISISFTTPVNCGTITSSTTMTQNLSAVGTCFTIGAADITLDCAGYKINYSTGGLQGYAVNNSGGYDKVKIKNCLIAEGNSSTNDKYAIFFNNSQNGTITNTTILTYGNYSHGIVLNWSADGNNVSGNTITTSGDTHGYGILILNSSNNSVIFNTISTTSLGVSAYNYGVYLYRNAYSNNISSNIISTNGTTNNYGIFLLDTTDNNTIYNNTINTAGNSSHNYGIIITYTNGSNISANTIIIGGKGFGYGIVANVSSSRNIIQNNSITTDTNGSNNYGIYVTNVCLSNNISSNTISTNGTGNSYGIFTSVLSHNNTITGNSINTDGNSTSNYGIYVSQVEDSNITLNTITTFGTGSNYGITGTSTRRNIVFRNTITTSALRGGSNYGIYFVSTNSENNISSNTITTNGSGNSYGIYGNSVFHNNTIYNNTIITGGNGSSNIGIFITSTALENNISWNTITTNGTLINYGILLQTTFHKNNVLNNVVNSGGNGTQNRGIMVQSTAYSNNISNNIITTNGTTGNMGIYLVTTTNNNTIYNNTIIASGSTSGNTGITLSNSNENNISFNSISTSGTSNNYGIEVQGQAVGNMLLNNTIATISTGTTNYGIYLTAGSGNVSSTNVSGNSISTKGSTSNYGIYLIAKAVYNNTITLNSIVTNGTSSSNYGIHVQTALENNITYNTISTFGTGTGYGLLIQAGANDSYIYQNTINTNGTGSTNYGIYLLNRVNRNNISSNTVKTKSSTAIFLNTNASNNAIYNNTLRPNSTGSVGGIYVKGHYNNITFNDILTRTSTGFGIQLFTGSRNNIINNLVTVNSTSSANDGLVLTTNSSYNNISGNTIFVNGTQSSRGVRLTTFANNNTFFNNSIQAHGNYTGGGGSTYGIEIDNVTNNTFVENVIVTTENSDSNYGIYLEDVAENNVFINNNISAGSDYEIFDVTPDSVINYLIYNNSYGEIEWIDNGTGAYVRNLTINVTSEQGLGLGRVIFIDNNTLSINLSALSPLRINGSANLTLYDVGLSGVDNFIFLNRYSTNRNDTKQNGTLCTTCTLFSFNSGTVLFNTTALGSFSANKLPAFPILLFPDLGNRTINLTALFGWNNSADEDLDPLSYNLVIDDDNDFTSPEVNVSGITNTSSINTTYGILTELAVDTVYFWKVQANDTSGYGTNSSVRNFTVDSFLAVNVLNGAVLFGNVSLGSEHSTDDNDPDPFLLENGGNIFFNISVTGTQYFTAVGFPSWYYQFKARENESGSFNTAQSAMTWLNMTNSSSAVHVALVDWHDVNDNAAIDLNVTVPSNESQGQKTSTITFTVTG